jgi:hypothetical protein
MRPGNGVCPQMRAVAIIAVTPPNNDLYIRLTRASADSVVGQAASSNSRESERRAINTACRGRPRDVAGAILSGWPLPIFAAAKSGGNGR